MKKLFLTSTLCIGVLFSSISFCNNFNSTNTPEEPYRSEGGLAIEGRIAKVYTIRIKISKEVLAVINGQNI